MGGQGTPQVPGECLCRPLGKSREALSSSSLSPVPVGADRLPKPRDRLLQSTFTCSGNLLPRLLCGWGMKPSLKVLFFQDTPIIPYASKSQRAPRNHLFNSLCHRERN